VKYSPLSQGRDLQTFYGWQNIPDTQPVVKDGENSTPQVLPTAKGKGSSTDIASFLKAKASLARTAIHSMGSSYSLRGSSKDSSRGDLSPDPALELRWCIGHTGKSPYSMMWSHDSRWILYPCSSLIVAMNPESSQQRFFIGHTADVTVLAVAPDDVILASCQEGKNPLIRLWDFATGDCLAMLGAHGRDVTCIDFNRDGTRMVAVGKEDKGAARNFHNCVVVWDISKVTRGGKAVKIAEQAFEPSLNKISFTPFEDGHLVSCGTENIHLWRIKTVQRKEELRKIALPLGAHGGENFLDLAFEGTLGGADPFARKIFASTGTGLVYEVSVGLCVHIMVRMSYWIDTWPRV
jgi:WD40 repeat protein